MVAAAIRITTPVRIQISRKDQRDMFSVYGFFPGYATMLAVRSKRTILSLLLILILALGTFAFVRFNIQRKIELKVLGLSTATVDTRPPTETEVDGKIKVKYPQDYTIVFLGDSMTEKLGNFDELRTYLNRYFPGKSFALLNYGYGSTNILSARERLEKETFHGRVFRPVLDIAFDAVLIESFGHNPLSEFPLEEGLAQQTQALDGIIQSIKSSNPKSRIVFVATIAPNSKRYAEGVTNLLPEKREEWAIERASYIENHIDYARDHNIPLIDIFGKSLDEKGDGRLDYIDTGDFIHPSANGVYLISEEIAKTLFENKLLQ